jgi:hypothetical protein
LNSILNKGLAMLGKNNGNLNRRLHGRLHGRLDASAVSAASSNEAALLKLSAPLHPAPSFHVAFSALACCCLVSLAMPQSVWAEPKKYLEQNQMQRLDATQLALNGVGIRNFLFFDFYEIALFLPQKLNDANAVLKHDMPRRVRITLLREVVAERDMEFLMAGLKENNTAEELAIIQIPLDQFKSMIRAMGKIAKGSVVQMDYLPNVGTHIWLNRRLLGTVPGAAFNQSVLKIWLGERPIQKNLKRELLGGPA